MRPRPDGSAPLDNLGMSSLEVDIDAMPIINSTAKRALTITILTRSIASLTGQERVKNLTLLFKQKCLSSDPTLALEPGSSS